MGNTMSHEVSPDSHRIRYVGPNAITNPCAPLLLLAAPSTDLTPWRIRGTVSAADEEQRINRLIDTKNDDTQKMEIVYYGLNSTDLAPETQARKLLHYGLGASVFRGGLFEWGLLREIFGDATYGIDNSGSDREASFNCLDFLA